MFVPTHVGRRRAADGNAQVRSKRAALLAVVGALTAALFSSLTRTGVSHGNGGHGTAVGLAIGIGAAALGLALARAIGRQMKA
jgi:hypothetical protein